MTKRRLVIATRESPLALKQTNLIKSQLEKLHPHLAVELLGITTHADKMLETTLRQIGGKGLFVKELEEALYDGRADIAVHSMKDVPMDLPDGLVLPVICERDDPRDALVSNDYTSLMQLPMGSTVGTASLRRQTQIRALRSDLTLKDLRGNINTRLRRLDEGDYDALILAAAGLKRMGFNNRIRYLLTPEESLPSAGQGALGIECREGDEAVINLIKPLNHESTSICVTAERAVCRELNGGCQVPLAAYAELKHNELFLRGLVSNENGSKILRSRLNGKAEHAESMGKRVAEELRQLGADDILRAFHE